MKYCILILILFITFSFQQEIHGGYEEKNFNYQKNPIDRLVYGALEAKAIELTSKNNNEKITFGQVLSCKTQTVSGINYDLKVEFISENSDKIHTYYAKLYVIPWQKTVDFIEFEEIQTKNNKNLNEEEIMHALQNFVVKKIYEKYQQEGIAKFTNIEDFRIVEKQVVSGIKYKIRVLLYSPMININNKAGELQGFFVTVVHQAWLDKFEIVDIQKEDYSEDEIYLIQANRQQQNQQVGAWKKYEFQEENDQILTVIQQLIKTELINRKIENQSFEILSTEIQVVSGYNIRVHFILNSQQKQEYETIIYFQPWNDIKQIISFEQIKSDFPETNVGSHVGGWSVMDIDELQMEENQLLWKLINKTIQNYLGEQGLTNQFEFISIEKQVVSGLKIKAIIEIDDEHYISYMLIQPWNERYELLSFEKLSRNQIQEEL